VTREPFGIRVTRYVSPGRICHGNGGRLLRVDLARVRAPGRGRQPSHTRGAVGYQPCLNQMGNMTKFNVGKITTVGQLIADYPKSLVIQALPTGRLLPYDKVHTDAKTSHQV
jgi:hypothetical protein